MRLPEVQEGRWYGTAGFHVRKKYFTRLREDDETLVVKVGFEYRDLVLQADPEVYFVTDHYRGYPAVLINLSRIQPEDLGDALEQAWRLAAPPKLVEEYDQEADGK